jgi:hypothetical protein
MTFRNRSASYLAAAAFCAGLANLTSAASAQDVMQLDLDFKNSLSRGHAPEVRQEGEGRRLRQEPVVATKRLPRRHRYKKP